MAKAPKSPPPDLSHIAQDLRPLAVRLDTLTADPANLRRHPERSVEAIKASLARFGQRKPVVVDAGGVTIAGAGLLTAARTLGWTHVAAVRDTELSKTDRVLYAIADNRTAELSEWDEPSLAQVLGTLGAAELEAAGFSAADLEKLIAEPAEPGPAAGAYREQFGVIVVCRDEAHQQTVFESLKAAGHECKVVVT